MVEPTPIAGVVEIDDGRPSGLALVVTPGSDEGAQRSGSVVLVPASAQVMVDGQPTVLKRPWLRPAAIRTLAQALMLDLVAVETMDAAAWAAAMGDTSYDLDNPDPVPASDSESTGDGQQLAFAVGSVSVGGTNAAVFLGRPVEGAALESVGPRRHAFWSALLADPPDGDHGLSDALRQAFTQGSGQLLEIPITAEEDGLVIDVAESEALLREVVPFPSGPRLKVRVVDRTGSADLGAIAALVAGRGIEVVEIANAVQFDSGPTELIVPDPLPVGQETGRNNWRLNSASILSSTTSRRRPQPRCWSAQTSLCPNDDRFGWPRNPRSGNTFLRMVLHQRFGVTSSTVYDIDGVAERLGHEVIGASRRTLSYDEMRADENLHWVKTHRPVDDTIHEDDRVIHLVRDGRDAVVSWARQHAEGGGQTYHEALSRLIDRPESTGAGGWGANVLSWSRCDLEAMDAAPLSSVDRRPREGGGRCLARY